MDKESEEIKEEINELRKRLDNLDKRVDKKIKKEEVVSEKEKKPKNKFVKILVILVILLLIIDIVSLVVYYKPDFSNLVRFNFGNNASSGSNGTGNFNGKCSDGTKESECSKNKPYFCYNGELVLNAPFCGCPNGYVMDFRSCRKV